MKSNELFKQILDEKIKEGTKIKVISEFTEKQISTIEYKNGRLNWVSGTFDTTFLCSSDIEFVIEENKEIKEIPNEIMKDDWRYYVTIFYNKTNELKFYTSERIGFYNAKQNKKCKQGKKETSRFLSNNNYINLTSIWNSNGFISECTFSTCRNGK